MNPRCSCPARRRSSSGRSRADPDGSDAASRRARLRIPASSGRSPWSLATHRRSRRESTGRQGRLTRGDRPAFPGCEAADGATLTAWLPGLIGRPSRERAGVPRADPPTNSSTSTRPAVTTRTAAPTTSPDPQRAPGAGGQLTAAPGSGSSGYERDETMRVGQPVDPDARPPGAVAPAQPGPPANARRTLTRENRVQDARRRRVAAPVLLPALVRPKDAPALREKIMLAVSSVNECRYCQWGHTRLATAQGVPLDEVNEILGYQSLEARSSAEAAAILFAQDYAENHGAFDPTWIGSLRAHYSDGTGGRDPRVRASDHVREPRGQHRRRTGRPCSQRDAPDAGLRRPRLAAFGRHRRPRGTPMTIGGGRR